MAALDDDEHHDRDDLVLKEGNIGVAHVVLGDGHPIRVGQEHASRRPVKLAEQTELGRIEFRDLTFRYTPDGPPVLRDINLVIEPGQTVALENHGVEGQVAGFVLRVLPADRT